MIKLKHRITMKIKLNRKNEYNGNSLFSIKSEYIKDVFSIDGKELKFDYNYQNELLTVFGIYRVVYVL